MEDRKNAETLDDADLDAAAGGYPLKKVFVTSFSTSGSTGDDRHSKGTVDFAWKTEEGN